MASEFSLTQRRGPRRPVSAQQKAGDEKGAGAFVLLVGAAVGAAFLLRNKGTTPSGACGPFTGPAANLPTGLYITYFDQAKTIGTSWWVVQGVGRWGIPSIAQYNRCWPGAAYPPQVGVDFGNADLPDNEYIRTIGTVSACTTCPPGSPGAATGA